MCEASEMTQFEPIERIHEDLPAPTSQKGSQNSKNPFLGRGPLSCLFEDAGLWSRPDPAPHKELGKGCSKSRRWV